MRRISPTPQTRADSYVTAEDTPLAVAAPGVLANDTISNGSTLTASLVSGPSRGSLTLNADGSFSYTPNANYSGPDSFTYRASNGTVSSANTTVALTVTPVNDAPAPADDSYSTSEDTPLNIAAPGLLANDSDLDGDSLSVFSVSSPAHGSLSVLTDGSLSYTPAANFTGSDSFTYRVSDGSAASSSATVTLLVTPVNDAPVATNDSYTTSEDTPLSLAAPGPLANDSDVDGDTLTTAIVSAPVHGVLTLDPDGALVYTPEADYNGPDSFTYQANDGQSDSNVATVSLSVGAVNDAPTAQDDSYSTNEDTALTVAAPGPLSNDSDADGDTLTAALVAAPAHGTLALSANGSLIYTPEANYNGPDSFSYRASDGSLNSNVATVSISVGAVNDAPTATDDSYSTAEDAPLSIAAAGVLANDSDVDGDNLSATLVSGPTHGTLTLNADGSFSYTPEADYHGPDSFSYQAGDGQLSSGVAMVNLTVTQVNDAPTAKGDSYGLDEDATLAVTAPGVLANDSDVDDATLSAVLVAGPAHGALTLNANGSFSYTPAANYSGPDSFTYRASDGQLSSGTVTVALVIGGANDAPTVADDSYSTAEDTALNVAAPGLLANDSDVDGDALAVALVDAPTHGTLTLNPDGSFSYSPEANYNGPDSFSYQASDGQLSSTVATVSLSITAVNDAPTANGDSYSTAEDTAVSIAAPGLLANDNDVEGSALTATLASSPSHGTLTLNADGSFSYSPDANYNGPDSFSYRANDSQADSAPTTVAISVSPVNDAPVATADSYSTAEDTTLTVAAPGLLANDSDIEGGTLSATLVSDPSHGALTLNADGSFSYTPEANYYGPDSFSYRANDGQADSAPVAVAVTVSPVNDAPTAGGDSYSTAEDTTLTVAAPGLLTNDSDVEGDALAVALADGPSHGMLTVNADGSFSYTPDANYHGPDSFTYRANDSQLASAPATVQLTVSPVNDAPVAADDSYSTNEDSALTIAAPGLLGNDSDPVEDSPLVAVVVSAPEHGSLNQALDGSFVYTPAADYHGPDSFTYQANDGQDSSNIATVTITVAPVNDAPVATDDSYSTDEDTPLVVAAPGLLENDSDVEGDLLSAVVVVAPAHGSLTLNADGAFVYTPTANYHGSDTFTYRVSDGQANSNLITVSLTVNPVNDAPVATDDSYTTTEDTALTVALAGVLANDSDVEGDSLSAALVSAPIHGTLTLNANGAFVYTPDADYHGLDSFTYQANDGQADSNLATVNLTITPVNDAPVAADDSYSTDEDAALTIAAPGLLANDSDPEGDPLTVLRVSDPAHGSLTIYADGAFVYTPDANYTGPDSFTYQASDGQAPSDTTTVTIVVGGVNDAPVATDDGYTTTEDAALTVAAAGVLVNDSDVEGDSLSATLVSAPAHGTLTLSANGAFVYTPDADYHGPDSFTYQANDGQTDSNLATVNLTITPVNDAPVAADDSYSTDEDAALTIAAPGLLANDSDPEGDPLTVLRVSDPAHGSLTLYADGAFVYTPDANYTGPDSFTYQASDGAATSGTTTVTIVVGGVNDAPLATDDSYTTAEDSPLTVAAAGVLTNDNDAEGDSLSATLVSAPAHGTLTLNANGAFSYTPDADYHGPDSFTYQANDGQLNSPVATVVLSVTPVNDAPTAASDSYSTAEDTTLAIAAPGILANESDPDGDSLSARIVSSPAHGELTLNADGSFIYTPAPNYSGSDSFSYRSSDGILSSPIATVELMVTPLNDAPVAQGDAYSVEAGTTLNVPAPGVLANDGDIEGERLSVSLVNGPEHGTLSLNSDGSFSYTAASGYDGPDSFTYQANDGQDSSNITTVSLTVLPAQNGLLAIDDSYSTNEDSVLRVRAPGVLVNDRSTSARDRSLRVTLVSGPTHGELKLQENGNFSYTPAANYSGPDSFTYRISDATSVSNLASVSLTINAVNDAPVAADDSYSLAEDTTLRVEVPGLLTNDSDVEGDALTTLLVQGPRHGSLTLNANGSFTYTPKANFNGSDQFRYKVSDGNATSKVERVSLKVRPVNDAPDCTNARALTSVIRETHGRFIPILILGCRDVDHNSGHDSDHEDEDDGPRWTRITVTAILQDEPVAGNRKNASDGTGVGSPIALVRAKADPTGNGRVYHIRFIATDDDGGQTTGAVTVSVIPNGRSQAIDDGARYDSTKE